MFLWAIFVLLLAVSSNVLAKKWFWSAKEQHAGALELGYKTENAIAWVGTLSGELHALDTSTGDVLWSADVGGTTIRSFQAIDSSDVGVVVPGSDGSIFVHSQGELKRFPLTVPDFVEQSPMFQVLPNGRKLTIVGSKTDRVFQLDSATGTVVRSFSSETNNDLRTEDLDGVSNSEFEHDAKNILLVNRHDYRVRAFDENSGKEVWNFTYGVIDPISTKGQRPSGGNTLLLDAQAKLLLDRVESVWKLPSPIASAAVTLDDDAVVVAKRNIAPMASVDGQPLSTFARVKRMVLDDGAVQLYVAPAEKDQVRTPLIAQSSKSNSKDVSKAIMVVREDSTLISSDDVDDGTCAIALGDHTVVPYLPETIGAYPNSSKQLQVEDRLDQSAELQAISLAVILAVLLLTIVALSNRLRGKRTLKGKVEEKVTSAASEMVAMPSVELSPVSKVLTESSIETSPSGSAHKVGKLTVYMGRVKGFGGNGTIVVEGRFEDRPVAVKRMQSALYDRASKEIDFLIQSEGHSNVVRYLAKEETPDFVYLALELCEMTLDQAIELKIKESGPSSAIRGAPWISDHTRQFLSELASATNHLHVNGIVHCDIKPQNVLVVPRPGRSASDGTDFGARWMPKLSDMGLSRNVDVDQSSFRVKSQHGTQDTKSHMIGAGTVGWRAPELLVRCKDKTSRLSRKVDVFSLGCVFFYVLQDGNHPYGEWLHRESLIVQGNAVGLDKAQSWFTEPKHLIAEMVAYDPSKRPSMAACLAHPLLWSAKIRLDFLCDISNRLEKVDPGSAGFRDLEMRARRIFSPSTGWAARLDVTLEKDVGASKHRKYDVSSFRDLLRYIRNKRHHFDEDPELSRVLSWEPEVFLQVFCSSFPDVVIQSFEWAVLHCGLEPKFIDILGGSDVVNERNERWVRLVPEDEPSVPRRLRDSKTERGWFVGDWVHDFPDLPPIQPPPSFNHKSMLCAHWERSGGQFCVMGSKCGFAHGPIELRIPPDSSKPSSNGKPSNNTPNGKSTDRRPKPTAKPPMVNPWRRAAPGDTDN